MGDLTVRGLDEEVLEHLSRRAAAHGRKLEEEAAAIIRAAITRGDEWSQSSKDEWVARAAESRRATGRVSVRTIDLIHEGREERMASLCP